MTHNQYIYWLAQLLLNKNKNETYNKSMGVQLCNKLLTILRHFLTKFFLSLPHSTLVFLGLSLSISVYLSTSWSISDFLCLSQVISGYMGLYWSILGYLGISWPISGSLWLFLAILVYPALSIQLYLWGIKHQVAIWSRREHVIAIWNFFVIYFLSLTRIIKELALLKRTNK